MRSLIESYLKRGTVIPGRPLIPGRKKPLFPAFYRVEERVVTFFHDGSRIVREELEAACARWVGLARSVRKYMVILIPHALYSDPRFQVFLSGWTLFERDGEVRTRQCVVFLRDDAVPIGKSDQGVICVAKRSRLSAWDGRTEEQSQATIA